MATIHSIQTVTGPILAIPVPAELTGRQVEITVTPVDQVREVHADRKEEKWRALVMEKPPVSAELRQQLLDDPDLLKTTGYDDPFGPACPPEDWEAISHPEDWEPLS